MGCAPHHAPSAPCAPTGVFGAVARALRGAPRARHARVSRGGCLALPGRSTSCVLRGWLTNYYKLHTYAFFIADALGRILWV
jgi:hypothetical protein